MVFILKCFLNWLLMKISKALRSAADIKQLLRWGGNHYKSHLWGWNNMKHTSGIQRILKISAISAGMVLSVWNSSITAKAADIKIDATFTDPAFNAYVRASFDTDGNGLLSDTEVANAKNISMPKSSYNNVICTSYAGIENLTSLVTFDIHGDYKDASGNMVLRGGNGPADLNLSQNTQLNSITISYTNLSTVELPSYPNQNTNLQNLYAGNSNLTAINNLSNCVNLQQAWINTNHLTSLDVSGCTNLKVLHAEGNDISGNTSITLHKADNSTLQEIWVSTNFNLTGMDVTHELGLTDLMMNGTKFSNGIDLSKNTALEKLYCYDASLPSLDLTGNKNLTYVWSDAYTGDKLKLSSIVKLETLTISASASDGSTTRTLVANINSTEGFSSAVQSCDATMQAGSTAVNAVSSAGNIDSAVGVDFSFKDSSGNEIHQPQAGSTTTLTMNLSNSGLKTPDANEEYVVYHKDGDTVTEVAGATVSNNTATIPASSYTGYYVAVKNNGTVSSTTASVQSSSDVKDASWCVTYLDCSGKTVKVQWVKYGGSASAPAGYNYPAVSNVTSHQDVRPTSCKVTGGYVVPDTADRGN